MINKLLHHCKTVSESNNQHAFNLNSDITTANIQYDNLQEKLKYFCIKKRVDKGSNHLLTTIPNTHLENRHSPFSIDC